MKRPCGSLLSAEIALALLVDATAATVRVTATVLVASARPNGVPQIEQNRLPSADCEPHVEQVNISRDHRTNAKFSGTPDGAVS